MLQSLAHVVMKSGRNWLLLLYEQPARRSSSRVSLWRKLKKTGAVPLKSSTYLLPDEPAHRERFLWLAQQVRDSGGDATLIHATNIEGLADEEIVRMFNAARAEDYSGFTKEVTRFINANRRKAGETFAAELERLAVRLEELGQVDFFDSPKAQDARMRLDQAGSFAGLSTLKRASFLRTNRRNFPRRYPLTWPGWNSLITVTTAHLRRCSSGFAWMIPHSSRWPRWCMSPIWKMESSLGPNVSGSTVSSRGGDD